jgi:hypothetical protein
LDKKIKINIPKGGRTMKDFNDIATKSVCEVYTIKIPDELRWKCMWAKIMIDEKHSILSCLSDAGDFSYRWPTEDRRTFKQFLTEISPGYLMGKIEPRSTVFDMEATCANLKRALFEYRRDDNITKEQARKEYDIIKWQEECNSEDLLMEALMGETETFSDDYNWTGDMFVRKHTPGAITFTESIFPLLQEALRIELGKQD